jgi:hypothetical protein
MTPVQVQPKTKRQRPHPLERPDDSRRSAENILREAAYVLELTRRVSNAIRAQKLSSDGSWC